LSEAGSAFRDGVYRYLLDRLRGLAAGPWGWPGWESNLRRRGLSKEEIDRRGYAPVWPEGLAEAARELFEAVPDGLVRVPGFYGRWQSEFLFGRRTAPQPPRLEGLLIPVRDVGGRVVALKARTGDPKKKYVWFSGKEPSGSPCHCPLGLPARCPVVRVTEGPLKADVAYCLDPNHVPTIGVGGVGSWPAALPVLEKLKAGVVLIAYDADLSWKNHIHRQLTAFAAELADRGYRVMREFWDEKDGKGIDDLFLNGGRTLAEEVSP
jgi:hypothetical protein